MYKTYETGKRKFRDEHGRPRREPLPGHSQADFQGPSRATPVS
jgi:hypothetical protein